MEVKLYRNRDLLERHKICLRQGEVHIWQIQWEKLESFWSEYQFIMSSHEVEKAENFHFFEDRMRYMAGKITVKLLLMQYLAEEKVVILNRRFGKPYHREVPGKQSVEFNLSHSGGMVLVAFGRGMDVGTDVQKITEYPDYMEIARNFYTATESDDVGKDNGLETFFEYWAAKEAYLKAVGIGLSRGMDFFSVRGRVIKENGIEKQDWSLIPVRIEGYAAFAAICRKEKTKMGYKKDMSQYEYLEGWERISLGEWLRDCAARFGESIAVTDYESELTYYELDNKVDRLASALYGIGIEAGDKVVIQLPNRISFIVSFFAVIRTGAIPILALPAHREAELEGIMKVAEPKAYIVAERYLGYEYIALAETVREKAPFLQTIIVDGEKGGDFLLDELDDEKKKWDKVDGYSTAVLLLSGGTTGVPKLIPRTHTDYLYNARMSAKRCELKSNAVYLASLPVAHNFPLCCPGLIGTMDVGGTVVLCKNTSPDEILSLITEKQVSITALVPAMVSMCMEMMEWDDSFDLSSLKVLQVGGAMLEDTLADKIIENWSCKLMQVFGTAEGLLCFTKIDDRDEIIARCQGTPVSPADEVRIVDEEGNEVQRGEFGELLSRGPYTIDGYYNAEEVNTISFTQDGYYKTGDRAMWTAEGNIRMGGRLKEQINRAGEKITPSEVEMYLCQYKDIKEAAVVGVSDEVLGNRNCAFIMTADGQELSRADIYQFLKEKGLAEYKIPDQVECIDSWPLTSVGKIDKKELVVIAESKKQGE